MISNVNRRVKSDVVGSNKRVYKMTNSKDVQEYSKCENTTSDKVDCGCAEISLFTVEGWSLLKVRGPNSARRGNGATVNRLALSSRDKSLASYPRLKQLLKAAWGVVVGMKPAMAPF